MNIPRNGLQKGFLVPTPICLVSTIYQSFTDHLILSDRRFRMLQKIINLMSHSVKIYDTCKWSKQIAYVPRTEDCVRCKRYEFACPMDFLSIRVYV
ncbi:hypothetical protein AMTRI_Chr09g22430 [Amborella trichopoda]